MTYSVQHVQEMIKIFLKPTSYQKQDHNIFMQASKTLQHFSKTLQCWEISFALLSNSNPDVKDLGSKFLKDKLLYDYEQISRQQGISLLHALIQKTKQDENSSKLFKLNISLSLIYLYIRNMKLIGQFISGFIQKINSIQYRLCIISYLPQEIKNQSMVISLIQMTLVKSYFTDPTVQQSIMKYLDILSNQYWNTFSIVQKNKAIKGLKNWIKIKNNPNNYINLTNYFLFQKAFTQMNVLDSWKLITKVIKLSKPQLHVQLIQYIAKNIFALIQELTIKVQAQQEIQQQLKMIIEFGKKAMKQFLRQLNQAALKFFQNLFFLFKSDQQNTIVYIQFWICLIQNINDSKLVSKMQCFIIELFGALVEKVSYPNYILQKGQIFNQQQLLDKSQTYIEITKVRSNASQLFLYALKIIYPQKILAKLLLSYQHYCQKQKYNHIGGAIWCISQVIPNIKTYYNELNEIIKFSIRAPTLIKRQVIILSGNMSHLAINNRQLNGTLFMIIIQFIKNNLLKADCCKSLEKMCLVNSEPFREEFAQVYQKIEPFILEENQLLIAIVSLLQGFRNTDIQKISKIIFQQIIKFTDTQKISQYVYKQFIIVKAIKNPNNTVVINSFRQGWPYVQQIYKRFPDNQQIAENLGKYLKVVMRYLKIQFLPFMQNVFNLIIKNYEQFPLSPYVYQVQVWVSVFSRYAQCKNFLKQAFCQISNKTFQTFKKVQQIQQDPQLFEDFFGMNLRILRYNEQILLQSSSLQYVIELGKLAIGCQKKQTAKAVYSFFQHLYVFFFNANQLRQYNISNQEEELQIHPKPQHAELYKRLYTIMLQQTPAIITQTIAHLRKAPSQSIRERIFDVYAAIINSMQQKVNWQNEILMLQEDILTMQQKKMLLYNIQNKQKDNYVYFFRKIGKRMLHRYMRSV